MKKKVFIFLLNIILLLIIIPQVNTQAITGEAVTGEATESNLALTISIIGPPSLSILSPENKTYLSNESILLNFSVISEDFIWYNLDSSSNITITSSTYINVTQGPHILNLYANNSQGETAKNVSFTANSTIFIISYNEFFGSNKGSSTDFNASTYEDIQNLSGVILEHTTYGKITFNEGINLTADNNFSDRLLNLNNNTNISLNRIELNSTALPNFDKSATIVIYNLAFDDPRILRDGSVCASSICTFESYSGGNLKFNVTGFSIYSAEETPITETVTVSTGGGGGTIVIEKPVIFEMDKELIKVQLKLGEKLSIPLNISNKHTTSLDFNIESNLNELLSFSETNFSIEKGQSKDILLSFYAKKDFEPGVYTGKIIIKTKEVIKEIPLIIEVKTEKVIFDVSLNIPLKYKEIFAGEKIVFQITIFNLGEVKEAEVLINYFIKDFEDNIIYSKEKTITVENQASFLRTIKTPKNLSSGEYIIAVETRYDRTVGTASDVFRIKMKETFLDKYIIYVIFTLIILIIILIIIILRHEHRKINKSISSYKRKTEKESRKIKEQQRESIKKDQRSKRLKEKFGVLEKAYAEGHISKESYEKAKKRIKDLLSS